MGRADATDIEGFEDELRGILPVQALEGPLSDPRVLRRTAAQVPLGRSDDLVPHQRR